jgi:hypothetical protein
MSRHNQPTYEFAVIRDDRFIEIVLRCRKDEATPTYFAILDYLSWRPESDVFDIVSSTWMGDHIRLTLCDSDTSEAQPIPTSHRGATFTGRM